MLLVLSQLKPGLHVSPPPTEHGGQSRRWGVGVGGWPGRVWPSGLDLAGIETDPSSLVKTLEGEKARPWASDCKVIIRISKFSHERFTTSWTCVTIRMVILKCWTTFFSSFFLWNSFFVLVTEQSSLVNLVLRSHFPISSKKVSSQKEINGVCTSTCMSWFVTARDCPLQVCHYKAQTL